MTLPPDYTPFSDKYFEYTKKILQCENLNPRIRMRVFARGNGKIGSFDETIKLFKNYINDEMALWISTKSSFDTDTTLLVAEANAQDILGLETLYLGILSHNLSQINGFAAPDYKSIKDKFSRLKGIYKDLPIVYFGARHYHYTLNHMIAKAALDGGAMQTSTDDGSQNITKNGVGTMPHALIIILARYYGVDQATLIAAKLFDKHIASRSPRMILIDTFNRELTDTQLIAQYFANKQFGIRIDTCGENLGEGCSPYAHNNSKFDPAYQIGNGVTIELVTKLRNLLNQCSAPNSTIFLSSGFGDEAKAQAFMDAHIKYRAANGIDLFNGVGVGEINAGIVCTADICAIDGIPITKTGRPTNIDYNTLERII